MSIIILNGTSSAGKSSIAKALQRAIPKPFLHFQTDAFWDMLPEGALARNFPKMKYGFTDAARAYAMHDFNIVMDIVASKPTMDYIRAQLAAFKPFIVSVNATLETLKAREIARGDRDIGKAKSQLNIHDDIQYDFSIDTTYRTATESADYILKAWWQSLHGPSPKFAFALPGPH